MRDILEEVYQHLQDNKFMSSHALVSALANEIVKLRCEVNRLIADNVELNSKLYKKGDGPR